MALRQHILTSLVLRYDRAVYTTLSKYARRSLKAGRLRFDLANEGMEIAYSGGFVDDIKDRLEHLKRRIIAGEIQVPSIPCERKEKAVNWDLPPLPLRLIHGRGPIWIEIQKLETQPDHHRE